MGRATVRWNLRSVDRDRSQLAKGRRRCPGSGRGVPAGGPATLADRAIGGVGGGQRDFEYLSGFASTPFHLVNYVAPGLFHRSPLWRPLVWDPFHTSPEEHLAYIGLIPLFLACMTMVRESRRDPIGPAADVPGDRDTHPESRSVCAGVPALDHRAGVFLLSGSLTLELGHGLGPGPAGGQGIRSLAGMAASGPVALVVVRGRDRLDGRRAGLARAGLVQHGSVQAGPSVARQFQRAFDAMPWTGDPRFEAVMAQARKPMPDPYVPAGLSPVVVLQKPVDGKSFASQRGWIYASELGETVALLVAILVIARMCDGGRLGVRTARTGARLDCIRRPLDSGTTPVDRCRTAPSVDGAKPGAGASFAGAARHRGSRIFGFRNLPMLVGLAPVSAYRTLEPAGGREVDQPGARIALRSVRPASAAGDRDELARR